MFAPGMMHHVTLRFSGKSLTGPRRFFYFFSPVRVCVRVLLNGGQSGGAFSFRATLQLHGSSPCMGVRCTECVCVCVVM